jgi:hypothetical protein
MSNVGGISQFPAQETMEQAFPIVSDTIEETTSGNMLEVRGMEMTMENIEPLPHEINKLYTSPLTQTPSMLLKKWLLVTWLKVLGIEVIGQA